MSVIDELVTLIGVDLDPKAKKNLESFKEGIQSAKTHVLALSAAVTAFAGAAAILVKGVADECAELESLSQTTGVSTDKLQEWAFAAEQAGVSASAVHGDLENLRKSLTGAGKDADESLMAMAAQMQGMSEAAAYAYGKARGLSDDTIKLLRQGPDALEDIRKKAHELGGIIPEDSIKMAAQFKRSLGELSFAFNGIKSALAIGMIPALSKVTDLVRTFVMENKGLISAGLSAIMTGIVNGFERFWKILTKVWDALKPVRDILDKVSGGMKLAEFVTHLVTGALTGLLILFAPLLVEFAAIGTAIAAVSFIFEDLFSSIFHGKGFIADLFNAFSERWPELGNAIRKVGTWLKDNIFSALETGWEIVKAFGAVAADAFARILDGVCALAAPVADFFNTFDERFPGISAAITAVADLLQSALGGAVESVSAIVSGLIDTFFAIADGIGAAIAAAMDVLEAFGQWVVALFSGNFEEAAKQSFKIFSSLGDMIKAIFVDIGGAILTAIKNALKALLNMLPNWVKKKIGISMDEDGEGQEEPKEVADAKTVLDDKNGPSPARTANGPASAPSPKDEGGKSVQNNDNRQQTFNVSTSDPQQAAQQTASLSGQSPQTPGSTPQAA